MEYTQRFGYTPQEEAIAGSIQSIASNLDNIASPEVLKQCFAAMDLTTLHPTDTVASVTRLVEKVNALAQAYPDYPLPASVCVFPNFASVVRDVRKNPALLVTTVAGTFPASQSYVDVKVLECRRAVENGADEIDVVLALNAFLAGDMAAAGQELRAMKAGIDEAAAGRKIIFKVILETGLLVTPEKIAEASFLAMEAGADFIKTSTGKVEVNATPMAAYVMCEAIRAYAQQTGRKVGFKAAGGISTAKDALCYWSIVSSVLGKEWLCPELFRLGVSRLGNNLIGAIEQKTVNYF